jgi:SAM-dependent methyltransferase
MREQNRRSWNAVTPAHNSHKRDQAQFLRGGGNTLFPEELELLGDVAGQRVVHLQCNCGQDSLSLAQRGAMVTGVDIADEAVAFAQRLAGDAGIEATFHRADLLDWFASTDETFDIAFNSYGGVGWISDHAAWARGVHRVLVPGGRLVFVEFHPIAWSLAPDGRLAEPYFIDAPIEEGGVNDYVGGALAPSGFEAGVENFQNPERSYSFQWTVGSIVQHLIDAELRIDVLREYPFSNGCELFDGMQRLPGNRYGMPEGIPAMPLMIGLVATK